MSRQPDEAAARRAGAGPGRPASQPPPGWQSPRHRHRSDPSTVVFVEELTGKTTMLDLSGLPVSEAMRIWLAEALARRVGARSGVKRTSSAMIKYQLVVRLAESLKTASPARPEQFGASHVKRFRLAHQGKPIGRTYMKGLRELLRDDPRLATAARAELFDKPLGKTGAVAPLAPYTDTQWHRLTSLMRGDIRRARDRIRAGRALLVAYRAGRLEQGGDEQRLGEILDMIDRTGDVPRDARGRPKPWVTRLGGGRGHYAGHRLCLAPFEATAFCLYLVALTGINFGTVGSWPEAHLRPDGGLGVDAVALIETSKPRRGPDREHLVLAVEDDVPPELAEILIDETSDWRLMRSPLRIYELLLELTELSRRHGRHQRAFGCLAVNQGGPGRWRVDLSSKSRYPDLWAIKHGRVSGGGCDTAAVDVRRLRQTVIERTRRPAGHTTATMNDRYLARSPQVQAESRIIVGDALRDQVDKARVKQQVPVLTTRWVQDARRDPLHAARDAGLDPATVTDIIDGGMDTVAAACADPLDSPFSEARIPCTASFLDCLSCPNARALPHHLPIQIGLRDQLAALRAHLEANVWASRYATAHSQLDQILGHYSAPERDQARRALTASHTEMINDLLDGRLDLR